MRTILPSLLLSAIAGSPAVGQEYEFKDGYPTAETIRRCGPEPCDPGLQGELAALGIAKGKPFAPDARMKGILEKA